MDDWESPTLGAWGLGWEVWLNGMECTQFTYFQQVGGFECRPVPARDHLRRAPRDVHQGVDSVYDLTWSVGPTATHSPTAMTSCATSSSTPLTTSRSQTSTCCSAFSRPTEGECKRTLEAGYVLPAYDFVLKCSHAFNLLDARGAISVTERQGYILRVRALAKACCEAYMELVMPSEKPRTPRQKKQRPRKAVMPDAGTRPVFEIGTESCPSGAVYTAIEQLKSRRLRRCVEARLEYGTRPPSSQRRAASQCW